MPLPGKYPGSKVSLVRKIEPFYPKHNRYICVFGGIGGELLLRKTTSPAETLNDINADMMGYLWCIRDRVEELITELNCVPYHRTIFKAAQRLLKSKETNMVKRAAAVAVCAFQGRANADPTSDRCCWAYFADDPCQQRTTGRWRRLPTILRDTSRRLQRVELLNWSWDAVIDAYDQPDNLLSVDPPYLQSALSSNDQLYKHLMSAADHTRLIRRLQRCQAKWLLFHYPCGLYDKLLTNERKLEYDVAIKMSLSSSKRSRRTETIWYRW